MPFSAMLDANVLVPNALRDTLLRVAEASLYRPLWSADILDETRRTILRLRPGTDPDRIDVMFSQMNDAFIDAMVVGYENLIESMANDHGDRHVLAAALVGRADVIVTNNVKHFASSVLEPLGIEALKPDRFLCLQYELAPRLVQQIIEQQSADTGRSAGKRVFSFDELLALLSKAGAPDFAQLLQGQTSG